MTKMSGRRHCLQSNPPDFVSPAVRYASVHPAHRQDNFKNRLPDSCQPGCRYASVHPAHREDKCENRTARQMPEKPARHLTSPDAQTRQQTVSRRRNRTARRLPARPARTLQSAVPRPADEPGVMQVGLVVGERPVVGQRTGLPSRLGENQLPGGRIPLVGRRGAHIVVHDPLGQQAKFIGAALLHDLQVGTGLP